MTSGLAPTLPIWNTLLAGLAAQGAWLDALSALQQVRLLPPLLRSPGRMPRCAVCLSACAPYYLLIGQADGQSSIARSSLFSNVEEITRRTQTALKNAGSFDFGIS